MYADGGNPVYREPSEVNGGCPISVSNEIFKEQLNFCSTCTCLR